MANRCAAASLIVLAALLLAVSDAAAQDVTVSEAMVPVVGTIIGLGSVEWHADVAIRNNQAYDVEVVLSLPGVPNDPFLFTTLRAGESMSFPDISRRTFGVVGRLSPLRIQTLAPASVAVAAAAYGVTSEGSTVPEVLTVQYGKYRAMLQTLPALAVGETFRTNIGLANTGDTEAVFVLALQKVPGHNIAVVTRNLPPQTYYQLPLESFFPLLTSGENLSLIVEQTSPQSYAYASVIANATHDARYYGPR
jgi:hypothetical protein